MNSENQKLIQAARVALHKGKVASMKAKKEEKARLDRLTAALTILEDDLRNEGVDPASPEGRAIFLSVVGQKIAKASTGFENDFDDSAIGAGWPDGY